MPFDRRSGGAIDEASFHWCKQRRQVALGHQQIVAALIRDLADNAFLATHGIDTDEQALEV